MSEDYFNSVEGIRNYYRKVFSSKNSRYRNIEKLLPTGKKVLDYGTGSGILAAYLGEEKSCHVTGIDPDKKLLNLARETWKDLGTVQFLDEEAKHLEKESFDFIVSSQVIEHTLNPGTYLANCNRLLKIDGQMLIGIPNIMTLRTLVWNLRLKDWNIRTLNKETLNSHEPGKHHIQAWDPMHFSMLLGACGFSVQDYLHCEGIALPKGRYVYLKLPYLRKLSYTTFFLCKKEKDFSIQESI